MILPERKHEIGGFSMIIEEGRSRVNGGVVHGEHAHIVEVGCAIEHGQMPHIEVVAAPGSSIAEHRCRDLVEQVRMAFRALDLQPPRAGVTFSINGITRSCAGVDGLGLPMVASLLEASGARPETFGEGDVLAGAYNGQFWMTPTCTVAISEETARTRRDLIIPKGFRLDVDERFLAGSVSVLEGRDPCAPGAVSAPDLEHLGKFPEPSPMDVSALSMDTLIALEAVALRQPVLISNEVKGCAESAARLLQDCVNAPTRHREALAELYGGANARALVRPEMSLASIVGGGRPIRPGAVALAQEGALYLQDVDRLSNTALKAVNGAWESVRIVRVDETVGFRTGFAPIATCEAGHEAAARSALQEICRGNAPYEATLPYVPDARAILNDLGAAREQGCLSTYVAERRETLAINDVTSLDAPGTVRSWPEGMDRNAAKEER